MDARRTLVAKPPFRALRGDRVIEPLTIADEATVRATHALVAIADDDVLLRERTASVLGLARELQPDVVAAIR